MRTTFFAFALLLAASGLNIVSAAGQGRIFNASRYNVVFTVYSSSSGKPDVFSLGYNQRRPLPAGAHRVFGVGVANGKKCSARTDASDTDQLTFYLSRDAKCRFER